MAKRRRKKNPAEPQPERELTNDEKRFAIWMQIFSYRSLGYSVPKIADVVKQPRDVVDDVLNGIAMNRIRRIEV